MSQLCVVLPAPAQADEQWSMDFVADALMSGQRIRILTLLDAWNRESLCLETDHSLTGQRVVRVLERLRLSGKEAEGDSGRHQPPPQADR